tara:strand:+ start:115 stop:348 length:234 start_codon:yes stop_codon:yes gene_type:complete
MLLGSEVEEILNKEFSFENFNNMTSGNGLILLKQDHGRRSEYSGTCCLIKFWGDGSDLYISFLNHCPSRDSLISFLL